MVEQGIKAMSRIEEVVMVIVADTMEVKGLEGEVIGPIVGKLLNGGGRRINSLSHISNEWERRIVDQFTLL